MSDKRTLIEDSYFVSGPIGVDKNIGFIRCIDSQLEDLVNKNPIGQEFQWWIRYQGTDVPKTYYGVSLETLAREYAKDHNFRNVKGFGYARWVQFIKKFVNK